MCLSLINSLAAVWGRWNPTSGTLPTGEKRGMYWSQRGGEAMVKIIHGIMNQTLRSAYLKNRQRIVRKSRDVKKSVKMSA